MDFTNFQVRKCPPSAIYVPNFITSEEEQRILSQIDRTPRPKWTQLLNRRLINYGGIPHPNGMIAEEIPQWLQNFVDKINNLGIFESQNANHVLVNEYLSGQGIMAHTDGPLFYPTISTISCGTHTVLEFVERNPKGNESGNVGISAAVEAYLPEEKKAKLDSSISERKTFGRMNDARFKILLEPRSLLILKDDLYTNFMHTIREINQDVLCDRICNYDLCENTYKMGDILQRGTRISLTIRNVPKTSKMKLKFF